MNTPKEILKIFEKYTILVDKEIKQLIDERPNFLMYQMMLYFFGYLNEDLKTTEGYGGKRFRPGICLLLADFYGVLEEAIEAATSIEIFHNFTLIHDDITDHDEKRRGRDTVWKKWGINHAINTGDAQLILANMELQKLLNKDPEIGSKISQYLNSKYLEIAEGQFLDFTLSELPINDAKVTEETTLDMVARKSAILVGAPAVVAGMVAKKSQAELVNLWEYGYNLGLTYQICDDIDSIWGKSEKTGKSELADIREKKKTLPIIYLYQNINKENQVKLKKLYNKEDTLTAKEVLKVKRLLDENDVFNYCIRRANSYLINVQESIEKLSISTLQKQILKNINNALFPILTERENQ